MASESEWVVAYETGEPLARCKWEELMSAEAVFRCVEYEQYKGLDYCKVHMKRLIDIADEIVVEIIEIEGDEEQ